MIAETENQRPMAVNRRVKECLDLFCGGGGSGSGIINAFSKLRVPIRGTFVNHWSEAIRIHDFNHPTHRHYLSGVEHIQPRKIYSPKQHLWYLWASPSCFVAGTLILSTRGWIPIEDIRLGDFVLTHKNRWKRVYSTMQSLKKTVTVKGHGHCGLGVTPEHKFWGRQYARYYPKFKNGKRGNIKRFKNPDWIPVKDLTTGYWATPIDAASLPVPAVAGRGLEFTKEFWWFGESELQI